MYPVGTMETPMPMPQSPPRAPLRGRCAGEPASNGREEFQRPERHRYDVATDREMATFIAEYERRIRIDRTDLDNEVENQPELFWKVADRLTLCISRRDAAKAEIKV